MQASGDLDLRAQLPSGPVEYHQHLLALSRPDGLGELGEGDGERRHRDRGEQQPDCLARAWLHKGIEIAPLVAMLYNRSRTLPAGTPDATQDGLEADTVLVGGPQFDTFLRVSLLQGAYYGW